MNCQRFESVVSELARGQMMAAEQRVEALAHSDSCDDCGARLRDEEMLTRGLQSLASQMEAAEASRAVEAKLLDAFRARQVVVPITRRKSSASYWLAAIAAMLLIAISIVAFRWNRAANEPREAVKREEPQEQRKPDVNDKSKEQFARDVEKPSDVVSQRLKPKRVRSARPDSSQVANHATKEIATDFIPLSYMSAGSLQDGGQIIRVQLPRSALANFGLPVNMDRYNEKVKADVLYGVDGMARAIRFVQ